MTERRAFRKPEDKKESASLTSQNRERKQKVRSTSDYSYSYEELSSSEEVSDNYEPNRIRHESVSETDTMTKWRKGYNNQLKTYNLRRESDPSKKASKGNEEGYYAERMHKTERQHMAYSNKTGSSSPWNYSSWLSKQSGDLEARASKIHRAEDHEISRGRSHEETSKIIEENYDNTADGEGE